MRCAFRALPLALFSTAEDAVPTYVRRICSACCSRTPRRSLLLFDRAVQASSAKIPALSIHPGFHRGGRSAPR